MALALGLAACGGGGSDLLPGTTASEINSNLDEVPELVAEANCAGAEEAVGEISSQVDSLEGVDDELKEALTRASEHLRDVVSGCEEAPEEGEEETEEPGEAEEAEEKTEKHAKEPKQEKTQPEGETQPPSESKGPEKEPPGQEKKEETEAPPETESPSGGVGPSTPVGGES
ncbi:MAG TPA: hypothetical protein VMT37_15145 [Solirubrobacterales bacterium]|nr:hypothetical protein [Solirubrobacterales bacterium]